MFCQDCKSKPNCKKVCKELQDSMSQEGIYSANYIRPRMLRGGKSYREIPSGNMCDLENVASVRAFKLKYGEKYFKNRPHPNA